MEMPQPTEEHRRLHVLAGDWVGDEKLSPSPWGPGGAAVGRYKGRVDLEGFFVVQDYVEEKDGRTVFRGHGVFGYDAAAKEYCWYWVDSMGMVPAAPSRGRWEGDTLFFTSKSPQGGEGRYTYRFESDRSYHFQIENSFDGGRTFSLLMEGTYRKQ
jgi:Protein of unknown function (DUF1579)